MQPGNMVGNNKSIMLSKIKSGNKLKEETILYYNALNHYFLVANAGSCYHHSSSSIICFFAAPVTTQLVSYKQRKDYP